MTIELKSTKKESAFNKGETNKKYPTWLVVCFILAVLVAIGGSVGCYFWGNYIGRNNGYGDGWNAGYDSGYKNGGDSNYNIGYGIGFGDGYESGYDIGKKDGVKSVGCAMFGGSYCY